MKENNHPGPNKSVTLAFGIFMCLFYIAVGILCIVKFFDIIDSTISYIVGGLLIIYGIFRGYRLYITYKNS